MLRIKDRILFHGIFLVALFILPFLAHSQKEFTILQYNTKNGLPQNSVKAMIPDKNGFLWLATEAGLVRYDGINLKVFNSDNSPILESARIRKLARTMDSHITFLDEPGNVYLIDSTGTGFSFFDSGKQRNELHVHGSFTDLPQFKFLLNETNKANSPFLHGPYELFSFPIPGNRIALLTTMKICIVESGAIRGCIETGDIPAHHFFMINGNIYYYNLENEFFYVNIDKRIVEPCSFNSFTPASVVKWDDGDDDSFMLSGNKLYSIHCDKEKVFTTTLITDKLPTGAIIKKIIYDKKNKTLFLGTNNQGLFVFVESKFNNLRYQNTKIEYSNVYYAQIAINDSTVLTSTGMVATKDTVRPSPFGFRFNYQGIDYLNDNTIIFGEGSDLSLFGLQTKKKKLLDTDSSQAPNCFFREGDSVWIAYDRKVAYVKNDSLVHFYEKTDPVNLISDFSFQVLRGPDKKLWLMNGKGVFRLNTSNRELDTLADFNGICVRNVTYINGYAFIGTYGNGFYLLKDNKLVQMPNDHKNYIKFCHAFLLDKNNFVWITTNQGLFKTSLSDLTGYFLGINHFVYYICYDEYDGIHNSEFNGGCYPSYVRLNNRYVSMSTMEGLVWFIPEEITDAAFDMPIIIDEVLLNNKKADSFENLVVPFGIKEIALRIATPYFGNIKNLQLEYKLINKDRGEKSEWSNIAHNPLEIKFFNLPSGTYHLQIRKKNGWGYNKYIYKDFYFSINKKYYETWWFILCAISGGILSVMGIAKIYAYNLRRKNENLEIKVNYRTAELKQSNQKLQDSIQVKDNLISIISHDIITPLKFISMVAQRSARSRNKSRENLIDSLKDIDVTSENLYSNAQNILNWIKYNNNRIDIVKEHVPIGSFIEGIFEKNSYFAEIRGNKLVNEASYDDIVYTDKNILSIVIYNIITNAIKFTENGTITISSNTDGRQFDLVISDTGIGIPNEKLQAILLNPKKAAIQKETPIYIQTGHGMGFIIINELLGLIDGKFHIKSEVNKGTSVTITLYMD